MQKQNQGDKVPSVFRLFTTLCCTKKAKPILPLFASRGRYIICSSENCCLSGFPLKPVILALLSTTSGERNAARLSCITFTWPISLLTLFTCRWSFLFQGRFPFVNLLHEMIVDTIETDLSLQNSDGTDHKGCSLASSSDEARACTALGTGISTAIGPIIYPMDSFWECFILCMYASLCPGVLQ